MSYIFDKTSGEKKLLAIPRPSYSDTSIGSWESVCRRGTAFSSSCATQPCDAVKTVQKIRLVDFTRLGEGTLDFTFLVC